MTCLEFWPKTKANQEKRPVRSYRQASPSPARHRPGAQFARPLRCFSIVSQSKLTMEIPMSMPNFLKSMIPSGQRRFKIRRLRRSAWRPLLECLDGRTLLTTVLYLDCGDRLPAGGLNAKVGALVNTTFRDNPNIDGPTLTDAAGRVYPADTDFTMTSFNTVYRANAAAMRTTMNATVRRFFLPLDIKVVVVVAPSLDETSS
jgi:hypothetical protein